MIRFLTAGESHGPKLTGIIEGVPAGLKLSLDEINYQLQRRQKGFGCGGRMRIENDQIEISSGVIQGTTTGAPIALTIINRDYKNWQRDIPPMTIPRPGHADLTGTIKYNYSDLRLALERASARETAMRVAVGAICRCLLQVFSITIGGYVRQIGAVKASLCSLTSLKDLAAKAEANEVRCPDEEAGKDMREAIRVAIKSQDTLGGICDIFVCDIPPGLGSYVHWDRRLDGCLAQAMMSIPAIKGVEIGTAFTNAGKCGSEVHDAFTLNKRQIKRKSNRAGGLEGGVSTGEPIVLSLAMKPISTVLKGIDSVDLVRGKSQLTKYERSDFCALPRVVPIGEAMMAIVISNALLEKLGGDSIEEMRPRFDKLRRATLDDLSMHNEEWRFDYLQ